MENQAVTFAFNSAKEILGVSTIILTATTTFAKDTFLSGRKDIPFTLGLSWFLYIVTVLCSIWTLLAITGELANKGESPNIFDNNVQLPAVIMIFSFLGGLVSTSLAGWQAVKIIVQEKLKQEKK